MAQTSGEFYKLPQVFGRYVLLRLLSRGGMGEVFLAKLGEIQGFEKPIVIKKVLSHFAQDADFLRRFISEAQIAIKLNHANIVPVYEVGMVDNEYFLALQYIEGRDLRTLLKRCVDLHRKLPPDMALLIIRDVCNGLAYAHRATDDAGQALDLVHCDINPPNVLISFEGEVKIIDFGIAKSALKREQTSKDTGFGKFGYMAPEQLIRGAKVDKRADIYSTGVILHELLTGERLYNFPPGIDYRVVADLVTSGKIDPPSTHDSKLTDRFDQLVMRALRIAPNERYQTAEEFRDAIQQVLYSINPKIHNDALSVLMKDVFADEIDSVRQMLTSISQTDVSGFQAELKDWAAHTISYAFSVQRPENISPLPSGPLPPISIPSRPSVDKVPSIQAMAFERPLPEKAAEYNDEHGTKKISKSECLTYVESTLPIKRRTVGLSPLFPNRLMIVSILLLGTIAIVGSIFWWVKKDETKYELSGALGDAMVMVKTPSLTESSLSRIANEDAGKLTTISPSINPPAENQPIATALVEEEESEGKLGEEKIKAPKTAPEKNVPEQMRSSATKQLSRKQTAKGPKKSKSAVKTSSRAAAISKGTGEIAPAKNLEEQSSHKDKGAQSKGRNISPAAVQQKFKQVRQEYNSFTHAYGQQLDSLWQQILFANTYGNMDQDKYNNLNDMLDNLRRKMREISGSGK